MLDGRETETYSDRMLSDPPSRERFNPTLWSVVLRAREGTESERRAALERLCGIYWPPLYAYLLRKGYSREDAQDSIQGFFVYLLTQGLIDRADADRGRFRSYLRGILDKFMANKRRQENAEKRGGGAVPLSLDFERIERETRFEPLHQEPPEAAYSRAWRTVVLAQAMDALRQEYERQGASNRFAAVCAHLSATGKRPSYSDLARQLGCTEVDVTNLIHRARRRLEELIREALRETVDSEAEVEDEIRDLFQSA